MEGIEMKTQTLIASCAFGLGLLVSSASAQSYSISSPTYSPAAAFYPGGLGYGYHSSTYEEGVLQGYASVITARGQANYLNGQAAVYSQEARSRAIKNNELATDTYFRTRQINQVSREVDRLSSGQYAALAKKAAPDRLGSQAYDTTFARLTWPAALSGDEFAADREALDRAFGSRSLRDSGADSAFYGEVRQLSNSMQKTLKSKVGQLDSAQYVAAKKFLMSLTYEATQPMVVRAVALR
jgi:hypothetical protein